MTSKTVFLDHRYYTSNGCGGGAVIPNGFYTYKYQLGSNTPKDRDTLNPYTMVYEFQSYGRSTNCTRENATAPWICCEADGPGVGFTHKWTTNDDIALINKLKEKFDEHAWNAPVFAGELGEATDMIFDRGRQLLAAAKAVKRGRLDKAVDILTAGGSSAGSASARAAKKASKRSRRAQKRNKDADFGDGSNNLELEGQRFDEAWLELSWGWKPLLGDVYEASKLIGTLTKPRQKRIVVRRSVKGTAYLSNPFVWTVTSYTVATRGQIIALINERDVPVLESLGLQDPEIVAWELFPFSMIADYFFNIGNYLEARAFAHRIGGTFVKTTFKTGRAEGGLNPSYNNNPFYPNREVTGSSGRVAGAYVRVDRTVSQSLGVPFPKPSLPFGEGWDNWKRILNVASLLGALFVAA